MRKRYYLLFTSDDGAVRRLSCSRARLMSVSAAIAVIFLFFGGLGLRSAALGVQAANWRARAVELAECLAAKDAKLLALERHGQAERKRLGAQVAALTEEKETTVAVAARELASRSALIDEMLAKIGLNPEIAGVSEAPAKDANSGGPFIALRPQSADLLNRADRSLSVLSRLPLGMPTRGSLASPFGTRADPLNRQRAFHAGMDFKGDRAGQVFATADGVVKEADWNGSFGRYVEIDHENGYSTAYAHLAQFVVEAGSPVQRGQLLGYIGSSGRSTGPHLHYELRYHGVAIDPGKYARIAATIHADKQKIRKR